MEKEDLVGMIVYANAGMPGNVQYLSDYAPLHPGGYQSIGGTRTVTMGNVVVAIPRDGEPKLMTTVPWLESMVKEASVIDSFATFDYAKSISEVLKVRKGTVGVDGWDIFPASIYEKLRRSLPRIKFEESMIIEELRMIKSQSELDLIRKAARLADDGLEAGVSAIREGNREIDIANEIEHTFMLGNPYYGGFVNRWAALSLVGCGARTGMAGVACIPTTRKLKKGELVVMDVTPEYDGYAGDISRAKVLGTPTEEQRDLYDTVLEIQKTCINMIRPGLKAKALQDAANRIGKERGYGKYVTQLVTHGIGLIIHERPDAGLEETEFAPNMVVSCEPAIATGKLGVRIEDTVHVTDSGRDVLTSFTKTMEL